VVVNEDTVWALIPPSTSFQDTGSRPILPDTKTIPFALMAWEKTGSGLGALGVLTSVIVWSAIVAGDFAHS